MVSNGQEPPWLNKSAFTALCQQFTSSATSPPRCGSTQTHGCYSNRHSHKLPAVKAATSTPVHKFPNCCSPALKLAEMLQTQPSVPQLSSNHTVLQRPEKKAAFHSKAGLKVSDMKSAKRVDRLQVEFCPRNFKWPRAHCKSTTSQNFARMKALFGLLCLKLG